MAAAAVLVLAGGGFGVWKTMSKPKAPEVHTASGESTQPISPAGTPSNPAAAAATPASTPVTTPPATSSTEPSPPPVSAPVVKGRVSILDVPPGAVITLNGRRQTGTEFEATPGRHTVIVRAPGFQAWTREIPVTSGQTYAIPFERRVVQAPAPRPVVPTPTESKEASAPQQSGGLAVLQIRLSPPANLYIDGAPQGEKSGYRDQLLPGTHTLRVEREGYVSKDTIVNLVAGQTATIRLQLSPRP